MAGRLPGVAVLSRRRSEEHHYHYHTHHHEEDSPCLSPAMDETALRARQRLHNKLEHLYFSLRSSNYNNNGGKEVKEKQSKWCKSWLCFLSMSMSRYNKKKERRVCCVCLEDLQQQQKQQEEEDDVMSLSCSHKYHKACLLPWLAAHSHCPYCRTPVHISS